MRLSTFMRASVVAGGLATTALLGGGTAFAATSTTVTPSSSLCHVKAIYGNTPINSSPSTGSSVVGHLTKGVWYASGCSPVAGGSYSACYYNSNAWYLVTAPTRGYVKYYCVEAEISA
ncbi:hypothetical protein [Actinoallomurus soli]|uniref:hypothetical protein n=1 Tax=Actinoallomurus soli TaxID=2952535 RepID=UPI002093AF43|nr:hypothetical protein [Actinoallomurus soli]MCO5972144.1 hypothetical protein [Actinoallomurus soli]